MAVEKVRALLLAYAQPATKKEEALRFLRRQVNVFGVQHQVNGCASIATVETKTRMVVFSEEDARRGRHGRQLSVTVGDCR
jgi:hypothetical protein